MRLNEKIYYYRKTMKLSQEELAARVGVSRQSVSKWELGEATPEVEKLLLLARVSFWRRCCTTSVKSEQQKTVCRRQTVFLLVP